MPESRIPASAGQYHGELRLTRDGMSFVPVTTRDGQQMCLGLAGWHLPWSDVAGIERVASRRGLIASEPGGDVRVHFDDFSRYVTVVIHGSLREFFDSSDELAAASTRLRAVA
ncbi:MAG: hypothetical protein JWM25_1883 [Thermoleophilia bacterium]|nr:hypothetical protein [Thermoleophilia bacterium]MCZ4497298.1 hypothetical protein [Thermoleophilia bacterium]